ncbi:zinc finger MYND domain-containing protein, putative [Eimeria tenella]|uniref:Zinc finger MYND domain-containing protein, putative n=1 Tax=Eimeria tenella TaxID=5802 RepID=U6KZE5_EIMTE|nr:zinc finger MYND domain-containing protein, putative [Eimeria tenella]CDJ40875.1 zinc finger MYND domain-containing protein, putative [Eimeria tenella]|eukprot:XP_013231625.1 zinc finger MYND domain-containing protein, putative [Eimeria tenella]
MAAAAAAAAASRCSELLAVGKCPEGSPLSLISKLRTFELKEIGSKEWLQQQAELEQLSAALHEEAISGGPETTLQCFCGTTKVGVLIEEIISIDLWKEKVLPFLKEDSRASSFAFYLPVYYEALLASILEILLFNPLAAAAAEAQLPDLVEYCHRKLQNMLLRSTGEGAAAAVDPAAAAAAAAASAAAAQQQQEADVAFAVEMCCLSILRFICDSRKDMQMTVTTLLYEQYGGTSSSSGGSNSSSSSSGISTSSKSSSSSSSSSSRSSSSSSSGVKETQKRVGTTTTSAAAAAAESAPQAQAARPKRDAVATSLTAAAAAAAAAAELLLSSQMCC